MSSSEAPKISNPIAESKIPSGKNVIKISASGSECSPTTFTVKEGALVNFAFISADKLDHFLFPINPAIAGLSIGASGDNVFMKSWNAPKKGLYNFECVLVGSKTRGSELKMIVE
jgi:hypothetical protein